MNLTTAGDILVKTLNAMNHTHTYRIPKLVDVSSSIIIKWEILIFSLRSCVLKRFILQSPVTVTGFRVQI